MAGPHSSLPRHDLSSTKSGSSMTQGLEPSIRSSGDDVPSITERVTTVRLIKRGKHIAPSPKARLRNSLLGTLGLLELANAADFAANVWNDIPVPTYVIVLMACGGALALALTVPAIIDAKRSWNNICFLREHRRRLRKEMRERLGDSLPSHDIDAIRDVLHRETGSECINRFGMNVVMGAGALIIGVGTIMAIWGANHSVWLASNILSGYLGNAPVAVYGLVNSVWCVHLFRTAQKHKRVTTERLEGHPVLDQLHRRFLSTQIYATASGLTTLLGGVGGMMTPTLWMGYVVLIPVIISSFACSFWWKKRLAYNRPFTGHTLGLEESSIILELEHIVKVQTKLVAGKGVDQIINDPHCLVTLLDFIAQNDMFEDFVISLAGDQTISDALFTLSPGPLEVTKTALLEMPPKLHPAVVDCARTYINSDSFQRLVYRERYLCDLLGSFISVNKERSTVIEKG
ncbi:unnamed protein product [Clonostachys rosea f. rosea IK726]|uniref:Uncharacterized protein n=1 Tax=Clonostachys rosea f. rosea IK726 TaxID=1349383 RepID=A0ACA9TG71_BIOOC|nr:unnamed protein product [Clonostachys rosea f. rosea IK726]